MSNLDKARRAAAEFLRQTTGEDRPEWRPAFNASSEVPDAIAPVCQDEDHERVDGSVYDCCPEPIVLVDPPLVDYLVALLNADRTGGAA